MKKAAISSAFVAIMMLLAGAIAQAQQPKKVPRIGFLGTSSRAAISTRVEGFRQGLREIGYVEGRTSLLNIDGQKGSSIGSPTLRRSWLVTRLMSS